MKGTHYGRFNVLSATLRGVEAVLVNVEVSVFPGLPNFSIVGMPDSSIKESKDRILTAIKYSGFKMPNSRIVVNLAPSFIKKSGSGFDLPVAVGILAATGQIPIDNLTKYLIWGELSLDGGVRSVPGALAYAVTARDNDLMLLGANCVSEAISISGVEQKFAESLSNFRHQKFCDVKFKESNIKDGNLLDFKDIAGHDFAKRAMQISACGNHGIIMVGPPGSGKTMLASRMPSILPRLTDNEIIESCVIHSISGEDTTPIINGIRPFRMPHHSATLAGLIGGGNPIKPGEVSLAHNGVLYLDELSEFSKHVLQGVRQPLESGSVIITRADGQIKFPAKFSLIAASNPCPCGYYGDSDNECRCSPGQIQNYQNKIGGPILDRIDMHLDISRIPAKSVLETGRGIGSNALREGVEIGRQFKKWRMTKQNDAQCADSDSTFNKNNGQMQKLIDSCKLSDDDFKFFEHIATNNHLSGRGIMRILSVSRTIADIEESEKVLHNHLCEALTFRINQSNDFFI